MNRKQCQGGFGSKLQGCCLAPARKNFGDCQFSAGVMVCDSKPKYCMLHQLEAFRPVPGAKRTKDMRCLDPGSQLWRGAKSCA
jgi:hypothetical protein